MISALLTAAVLFAQAAPEAAAPAAPAAAPDKTVSPVTVTPAPSISKRREADPTEVVCTSELPIGSRFPVKTCAPRRDRQQRTQEDQMEVRRWTALRPGSGN
jgi:hypothetical protein